MTERDRDGRTALHYAALDGSVDAVRRLLEVEDVNAVDDAGWTPLHFAAQGARADVAEALLDAGARVDAVDDRGQPPLYWAVVAASGDPVATIRVLRARGADPTAKTMLSYFGPRDVLYYVRESGTKPEITAEFTDLP